MTYRLWCIRCDCSAACRLMLRTWVRCRLEPGPSTGRGGFSTWMTIETSCGDAIHKQEKHRKAFAITKWLWRRKRINAIKSISNLNMKALQHPRLSLTLSCQMIKAVDDLDLRFRRTAERCQLVQHQFRVTAERFWMKYRRDSEGSQSNAGDGWGKSSTYLVCPAVFFANHMSSASGEEMKCDASCFDNPLNIVDFCLVIKCAYWWWELSDNVLCGGHGG